MKTLRTIRNILLGLSLVGLWNMLAPLSLTWMEPSLAGAAFGIPIAVALILSFVSVIAVDDEGLHDFLSNP